jgi:hypothetical protein
MERSKQTWGSMIQAQDRKSHRSAVACKDLRTAVYIKIFLIGMLWIANSRVCWGELTDRQVLGGKATRLPVIHVLRHRQFLSQWRS